MEEEGEEEEGEGEGEGEGVEGEGEGEGEEGESAVRRTFPVHAIVSTTKVPINSRLGNKGEKKPKTKPQGVNEVFYGVETERNFFRGYKRVFFFPNEEVCR